MGRGKGVAAYISAKYLVTALGESSGTIAMKRIVR